MNFKNLIFSSILLLGITLFFSCSEDDNELSLPSELSTRSVSQTIPEGRFDNVPFQWDYSLSTDSLKENPEELIVYPVKVQNSDTIPTTQTRAWLNNRRSSGQGSSRRGGDQGGSSTRPDNTSLSTSDLLINNPSIVYVGAAFPESEFGKTFSKEYIYPRNPIEISTSFSDPYMGEITKETGSFGYKKFMKEVLHSAEYKSFLQKGGRESLKFECSEYFSYSDIEKAFSSNAGLAKIFSAKVQTNSKKTNIKSRLIGQLVSRNFTVKMENPVNGFFKDKSKDTSLENPVYISSISYGKIALLSVESEYSFEEVKKAVEAGVKWKIFNAGGSFSSKDTEVLQKSTITLYLISDDTNGEANQYFSSLDDIKNAFQINYSEANFGLPIFCIGYYTKDNSLFTLTTGGNSRRDSGRDSGSRRDSGGTTTPRPGGRR
jgi:thiol-activated cytolysin